MKTKERSAEIVNFITPGQGSWLGRGYISHKVKIHYFFKIPLLYSLTRIGQSMEYDKLGSAYQICKFHIPMVRIVVLRFGQTGDITGYFQ